MGAYALVHEGLTPHACHYASGVVVNSACVCACVGVDVAICASFTYDDSHL